MEALPLRSFDLHSLTESIRSAPLAWLGALAVAALPAAVLALKPSGPAPVKSDTPVPQATRSAPAAGGGQFADWFGGADNPFLTEEQARERRLRASLARVEEVLRRRPDVRDVTVLATPAADAKSQAGGAVVTVRMQEGTVPVALVDAVGTLVAAAVPGVKPADVTVIDEGTGIRARAVALDDAQSQDGRKALAAAERAAPAVKAAPTTTVSATASPAAASIDLWPLSWNWIAIGTALLAVGAFAWFASSRRQVEGSAPIAPTAEDPIAGTLAMALHRCVAEQGTLVTTALVERLEQGASPNEVAQLLLNLEPWAAERLLKAMPPEALAKVEQALRDPAGDAPTASVRALAEAVISVRAAA